MIHGDIRSGEPYWWLNECMDVKINVEKTQRMTEKDRKEPKKTEEDRIERNLGRDSTLLAALCKMAACFLSSEFFIINLSNSSV